MTQKRQTTLKYTLLTAAVGLIIICWLVLAGACAPATPAGEAEATPTPTIWIIDDTSPSELATAMAAPSATALPDDFVWPTEAPYAPPLTVEDIGATLAAKIATEQAQQSGGVSGASGASAETPTPEPTPTPVPLTEQVTQFARDELYDVVVHARAGASRNVTVPANVKWPPNQGTFPALTRTRITPITTYYGTLTAGYELITPQGIEWAALDADQEYVLFISKTYASASKCSEGRGPGQRCLNQAQLNAVGGPGGIYLGRQSWIVDGDRAWRIPDDRELPFPADFDLTAEARAGGETLSLSELETAIRAGLPQ